MVPFAGGCWCEDSDPSHARNGEPAGEEVPNDCIRRGENRGGVWQALVCKCSEQQVFGDVVRLRQQSSGRCSRCEWQERRLSLEEGAR